MNDEPQLYTPEQLADFETLLSETLSRGAMEWLARRLLGEAGSNLTANARTDKTAIKIVVRVLRNAGRLGDAIAALRAEGVRSGRFAMGLNHIMSGYRLKDLPKYQTILSSEHDPFLHTAFLEQTLPAVQRAVCAIGLLQPRNKLMGTGFLIGPDMVITNYHVLEDYLTADHDGVAHEKNGISGDNIRLYFDYLTEPGPPFPPDQASRHESVLVKAVKQNWLVRGRRNSLADLTWPRPDDALQARQTDYAVVRLEREIGNMPSRRSGGIMRGWLSLDSGVNFVTEMQTRMIVVQHPGGKHQLFDIGVYEDMNATRIVYTTNTLGGTSGSPAFDKDGRLFAVHNAAVNVKSRPKNGGARKTLNQGIRADKILDDLKNGAGIALTPPKPDEGAYWSLSDDMGNPKPIIGRHFFREIIKSMMKGAGAERLLAVVGPKDAGRQFSVPLLRRIVGPFVHVVEFTSADLRRLEPPEFLQALLRGLMILGARDIPPPPPTEMEARWLSNDVAQWMLKKLAEAQKADPSRYPAWIVMNAVDDADNNEGESVIWADKLPDLVSGLIGASDAAHGIVEIPQLRWLFIGETASVVPPTRIPLRIDDLTDTDNTAHARNFSRCLSIAWRSMDKNKDEYLSDRFLQAVAGRAVKRAKAAAMNPLKELAAEVWGLIEEAPDRDAL